MNICRIDGCEKPAKFMSAGVCQMHYFRMMRNGTYELSLKQAKKRIENPAGYQKIHSPGHPLANSDGYAYEHRLVVFDRLGEILPPCSICGKDISWETCHIDHIDNNVRNNAIENLRPLCRPCNTFRGYPARHTFKRNYAITFDGETKTVNEWANDSRVNVSGHAIKDRMRRGMSIEDALFSPKKTHTKTKVIGADQERQHAAQMDSRRT